MKNRMQRRDFLRSGLVLGGAGMLPMPLWAMNLPALATRLHAGPMLGYPAYRSATVWVQTLGPAQVQIRYQAQDGKGAVQHSETVQTDAGNFYSVNIVLDELQPDTRYQTQLLLNNQVLPSPGPLLRTPSLWKFRAPAPDFKVLTGSCAYINDPRYDRPGKPYGGGYEIYEPMRQEQADLMIWLGDNLYFREADFASPAGMALRYWSDRAFAPLQRFLNSTPQIAIWDDHDYGPNDSDSSFIFKETALRLFQSYWPQPQLWFTRHARGIHPAIGLRCRLLPARRSLVSGCRCRCRIPRQGHVWQDATGLAQKCAVELPCPFQIHRGGRTDAE